MFYFQPEVLSFFVDTDFLKFYDKNTTTNGYIVHLGRCMLYRHNDTVTCKWFWEMFQEYAYNLLFLPNSKFVFMRNGFRKRKCTTQFYLMFFNNYEEKNGWEECVDYTL